MKKTVFLTCVFSWLSLYGGNVKYTENDVKDCWYFYLIVAFETNHNSSM